MKKTIVLFAQVLLAGAVFSQEPVFYPVEPTRPGE